MFKLCHKDYLAGRWLWLLILLLYAIVGLQAAMLRSGLVLLISPIFFLAWLAISDVIDDKNKTAALYASLPLTRTVIVRGRYLLAGILTLAGAAFSFGLIGLARLIRGIGAPDAIWPRLLSLTGFAGFVLASSILAALYLPISFAFGPGKAAIVFPAVLAAAAAVLFGLERLITKALHLAPPLFTPGLWRDPGGKIAALFDAAGRLTGGLVPFVFALMISAALLAGSSAVAVRAYRRREF
jgi:hypothetical protein